MRGQNGVGARGQCRLKPHPCLPGAVDTQVGVKTRKQQWGGGDKGLGQFSLLRLQTQMRDTAVAARSGEAGRGRDRPGRIQGARRGRGGGTGIQPASGSTPLSAPDRSH